MIARRRPQSSSGRAGDPGAKISEAIRRRALLQFRYNGHLRVVAPYCFGVSTRDVDSLRAVQVRGSSTSNAMGFGNYGLCRRCSTCACSTKSSRPTILTTIRTIRA